MSDARASFDILVVEDTPAMAKLTLMTLQRGGFSAVHVEDGETAIEFLGKQIPHLILLDLNLPGLSGWDVMEYLTAEHADTEVKVIITTAYGDAANRVVGKLREVHKYMVKPFKPLELIATVEGALGIEAS
ncbi:MAG: response regulator [Chloroflexota bacterium]